MTLSPLVGLGRWNWDGDRIVHDCVVPSGRPAVGHAGPRYVYPIDVREFLVSERNEVLRRAVREDLSAFAARRGLRPALLQSREAGSFDLRAAVVAAFVADRVAYRPVRGVDYWQFPDETLFLRGGDCEDRALLIAALLIASGVSSFNVRVALGKVRVRSGRATEREHDHAWVAYKSEAGRWQILEPLVARRLETRRRARVRLAGLPREVRRAEYVPYYLFNDVHLWEVAHGRPLPSLAALASLRRRWSRLKPEFAGETHRSIVTQALSIPECPPWFLQGVMGHFISLFGQVIDEQDDFFSHGYDCRDHFDNGFVREGWDLVAERLAAFRSDNGLGIDAFASAAHAIADFYAHTSYAHFADRGTHEVAVCDPDRPLDGLAAPPSYEGGDFDLASGPFTTGPAWTEDGAAAAAAWDGKLLSGRYAQRRDSRSFLEALCPTPRDLEDPGDRAALPHHDEIAVDGNRGGNALYPAPGEYHRQFVMRRDAAVEHIRMAFKENWARP